MSKIKLLHGDCVELMSFIPDNYVDLILTESPINNMGIGNLLSVKNQIGTKSHPTEKPEKLMDILISSSTNEGDTVLDPFMGSGTTGASCKRLDRNFIGMELSEIYFEIARKRIELNSVQ